VLSAAGQNRSKLPLPTLEAVASFENLHCAFRKASQSKLKRPDVARFNMQWESGLTALSGRLLAGEYIPGNYRVFTVYEKKTRTIMAAPFIDRIVHHAVCNVVTPHLERSMTPHSCANRVGMGTRKGLELFGGFAHNYRYVLKCDIRQFFPSLDRDILISLLGTKISDARLIELIRLILFVAPESVIPFDYFPDDTLLSPCEHRLGLPIGNMTSQTWANWYLNGLDHFVMDYKGHGAYVRYVDDFVVFGNDKAALNRLKDDIAEYLQRLRLRVHPQKTRVYHTYDGVPFLGFRHYASHRVPVKQNIRRFKRRIRDMHKQRVEPATLRASIAGWAGFARLGDTARLRSSLCARLERLTLGQGERVPRSAWGLVEQQRQQPSFREPQQEQPGQPQQQQRLPVCSFPA
jgi:RNA-directed DNA polymerase